MKIPKISLVKEVSIDSYLQRQCSMRGWECIKVETRSCKGWPDRLIYTKNHHGILVETKKPKGGVLSPSQKHVHKRMALLDVHVFVAYTKEDVDKLINSLEV